MNPLSASKKLLSMAGELGRHPQELPYSLRWLRSMLPGHSPLHDEVPWITFRAIDWLDRYLTPEMSVFEYGAGGSTLYFAKRVRSVVSVEHDEGFFKWVQEILARRALDNCQLMLHTPQPCTDSSQPFASYQDKYRGQCFESYVRAIDGYPDRSFDLVLVDGRARLACVKQAIAKLKPGGALMLDNTDRPAYAPAGRLLNGARHSEFPGLTPWNLEVSQTSVWQLQA
jgi:predicted O-methyltransferase YrrM